MMMMQAGDRRIAMLTGHVPLMDVERSLSAGLIVRVIETTVDELTQVYRIKVRRAVVAALNPHAGESGRIGREERRIIAPALLRLQKKGFPVEGPVPADTAWRRLMAGEYDLGFGMYHDQVMIPFKLKYPRETVNVTLGLPFVRTSPAHGVAYDIAGKGRADPRPMEEAVLTAARMAIQKG